MVKLILGEITMQAIKYLRRKNLGNYEHEELEVSASVEGSDPQEVMDTLKAFVLSNLGLETSEKVEAPKKEIAKKEEVKVTKEKPQAKEEEVKEEVKEEEAKEEEVVKEEPKKEEAKEEKKPKAKKETTVKVKATKLTAYDREHDPHKALLSKFLDEEFKGWRKPDELKKAGAASRALNGTDFQDGNGEILESFKEAFRKMMN
jgi:outer membrane biosynthesis protein TonB